MAKGLEAEIAEKYRGLSNTEIQDLVAQIDASGSKDLGSYLKGHRGLDSKLTTLSNKNGTGFSSALLPKEALTTPEGIFKSEGGYGDTGFSMPSNTALTPDPALMSATGVANAAPYSHKASTASSFATPTTFDPSGTADSLITSATPGAASATPQIAGLQNVGAKETAEVNALNAYADSLKPGAMDYIGDGLGIAGGAAELYGMYDRYFGDGKDL